MKHLFFINSNITMLVAMQTIKHEQLALADCRFLTVRDYKISECFNISPEHICDATFLLDVKCKNIRQLAVQTVNFQENRRLVRAFDKVIEELTGGDLFEVYIAHGRDYRCDLVVANRKCLHYSFLEEGSMSYLTETAGVEIYSYGWLKRSLHKFFIRCIFGRHAMLFSRVQYYDCSLKKFKTMYGCYQESFPIYENKIVVGAPFEVTDEFPADLRAVIIFDSGFISEEDQKKSLELMFEHALRQSLKKIHYKFHPAFSAEIRDYYRKYFDRLSHKYDIESVELPDSAVMENIAYTLKEKLSLYLVCSSVGIYASLSGSVVYCTGRHFIDNSPCLRCFFDLLPESFFNRFNFI